MVAQPNITTLPDWQQKLAERGILETALECGWTYYEWFGTAGWAFPLKTFKGHNFKLPDGRTAQRWKALDRANASQAYAWGYPDQKKDDIRRPENCNYYWAWGVEDAIKDSWGWLYITAGEPDMLSMLAAGIRNVTTFFGEGNIPDSLAQDLKLIGVSGVCYLADMDNAGIDAAVKLVEKLDGVMPCDVKQLPCKDVNDLWIQCKFDKAYFVEQIADLPLWKFNAPPPQEPKDDSANPYYDYKAFAKAVEKELNLKDEKRNGWSKAIPCIFGNHEHDDKNPSAGWHYKTHTFRCFKCGETWDVNAVAERVNVRLEDFDLNAGKSKTELATQLAKESKPPTPQKPQPAPVNLDEMFVSSDRAMQKYRERLDGQHVADVAAAPFPFTILHHLDGFAEILKPRKMVCVVGLSGGGKTSFLESGMDILRQSGDFHALWWGKEWSWEEMADRAVQRQGGLTITQVAKYEMHLANMKNKGKSNLSKEQVEKIEGLIEVSKQKSRDIEAWAGKVFYVDKGNDIEDILARSQEFIDQKKSEGIRIRVSVWDYMSLFFVKGARTELETINRGLAAIKEFTENNDLFTFVASQPRKGDATQVKDGEKVLTAEDALFANDHKFNLMLTLNPTYIDNIMQDWGIINVVKNSGGRCDKVSVQMDLKRLRWLDQKPRDGMTPQ